MASAVTTEPDSQLPLYMGADELLFFSPSFTVLYGIPKLDKQRFIAFTAGGCFHLFPMSGCYEWKHYSCGRYAPWGSYLRHWMWVFFPFGR